MDYLRSVWKRVKNVPTDALRVFARNWAPMITIIALGLAARQAFIWLAIRISEFSPMVAALVLPFAGLSVLVSLIVTLRYIARDLPLVHAALADPRTQSPRSQLLTIGGLLIPFLSVYAANGFLKADSRAFIRGTWAEEAATRFLTIDYTRASIGPEWQLVILVVAALVLRKVIGVLALGTKNLRWAGTSAYLEALWMITASVVFASFITNIRGWVDSRAVMQPLVSVRDSVTGWIDQLTGPFATVINSIGSVLGQLDDVFIVPIAWLMMGVSVYGVTLATKAAPAGDHATRALEDPGTQADEIDRRKRFAIEVRKRAKNESRAVLERTAQPVVGPIKTVWSSLQNVAVAGVAPVVVFCLLFIAAEGTKVAVLYAARYVVGPQTMYLNIGLTPFAETLAFLAYFLVALTLTAPAIDRLLQAAQDQANDAAGQVSATEATNAASPA